MFKVLSHKTLGVSAIALSFVAAWLLYENRPRPEPANLSEQALLVDVAVATPQAVQLQVRAQGEVLPWAKTALTAEVSGQVIEIHPQFRKGGFFSQGEVLLRIDDTDYRAALYRAEANLRRAESLLAQEQAKADVAQQEWEKLGRPQQRTPQQLALYLRRPQVAEAQANVTAAQAELNRARKNLQRTEVRAPYDALVTDKQTDLGQFLNVGHTLGELVATEKVEVRLPLTPQQLSQLPLPDTLSQQQERPIVTLSAQFGGEQYQWQGHLQRSEGVLDRDTRVLRVIAEIDDPYGRQHPQQHPLRIGTYVSAQIQARHYDQVIALPRHLLQAGDYLWVVDADNRLFQRQVQYLHSDDEMLYITAGLQAGERICLSSLSNVLPGTAVRINEQLSSQSFLNSAEAYSEHE